MVFASLYIICPVVYRDLWLNNKSPLCTYERTFKKVGENDVCPVAYSKVLRSSGRRAEQEGKWDWDLAKRAMVCRYVEGFTLDQTGNCCWLPVQRASLWLSTGTLSSVCWRLDLCSNTSRYSEGAVDKGTVHPVVNKSFHLLVKKKSKMFHHSFILSFPAPFKFHAAHFLCKWDVHHKIIFFGRLWIFMTLRALTPHWDDLTCCKLWKIVWIHSQTCDCSDCSRGEINMRPFMTKYILITSLHLNFSTKWNPPLQIHLIRFNLKRCVYRCLSGPWVMWCGEVFPYLLECYITAEISG